MKKDDIEQLKITDFHYNLPDEKIAKYPLMKRDESKLLLFDKDAEIQTKHFLDIGDCFSSDSLLIFNNTRVIHARLLFRKETGATVEVFCLSPCQPEDYALNFQQRESCLWHCMIGNAKRWRESKLSMKVGDVTLTAEKIASTDNDVVVQFSWDDSDYTFSELLELAGKLPIPPYLNRPSEEKDDETYQTVYSSVEGSVAAPTAGLHFTEDVFRKLQAKGIETDEVTLHVGAGTFRPVKAENIGGHDMHTEFISVSRQTIEKMLEHTGNLVAVGTTSVRTLESLYYIGKKLSQKADLEPHELTVSQWEPYQETPEIPPKEALRHILRYLDETKLERLISATRIIIVPGYRFHYIDAVITNFHQPESTLLLLVAAFVGDNWRKIYNYALQNNYRFLSYGDSSLLWRKKVK